MPRPASIRPLTKAHSTSRTYTLYASSAAAANTFFRSVVASIFPILAHSIVDALGTKWGSACPPHTSCLVPWNFHSPNSYGSIHLRVHLARAHPHPVRLCALRARATRALAPRTSGARSDRANACGAAGARDRTRDRDRGRAETAGRCVSAHGPCQHICTRAHTNGGGPHFL